MKSAKLKSYHKTKKMLAKLPSMKTVKELYSDKISEKVNC